MSGGQPVERVRGEHPGETWRADSLARSDHSRVLDFLQQPLDDPDPDRATALCSQVARNALQDLAPALVLLPADQRARCQIVLAYTLGLFDFALQPGTDGERLARLNRWEFDCELALDGDPPGQPVFVALAAEHRRRPFDAAAIDDLAQLARQIAVRPRPRSRAQAEARWRSLGTALAAAFLDPSAAAAGPGDLLQASVRIRRLQAFTIDRSFERSQVPTDEWPPRSADLPAAAELERYARDECDRIETLLATHPAAADGEAPRQPRFAAYLRSATSRLLQQFARRPRCLEGPLPRLGIASRISLLLSSRWRRR